jgi:hypothetical protein
VCTSTSTSVLLLVEFVLSQGHVAHNLLDFLDVVLDGIETSAKRVILSKFQGNVEAHNHEFVQNSAQVDASKFSP